MTAPVNWHLERNDGTEWTQDALDRAVRTLRAGRYGSPTGRERCLHVTLDPYGSPFLLDDRGEWWRADYDDCNVVWDRDPRGDGETGGVR